MTETPGQQLTAAIYNRVSRDRRRRQKSVGEQKDENRDACVENEWRIGEVYTDNDKSASRFSKAVREDWDRLIEDLAEDQFNVLVLWESSRGDRKPREWFHLLDTCRERRVLIHITSHDRTYDMSHPRDWRVLADDGVDSAYESEKTSQRGQRSARKQAAKGAPHGKLLYGYRREYDPGTGALLQQVVDEWPRTAFAAVCASTETVWLPTSTYTTANVVRECARRILAGESCYAIALSLNRRGIPSPRKAATGWSQEAVKAMVLNPGYIGKRIYRGEVIGDASWLPILTVEDHNALKDILTDPARTTARDRAARWLLSGIAVCGVCGAPVRVQKNRGYRGYLCIPSLRGTGARAEGASSFHVSRRVTRVDAYIRSLLFTRLSRPDAHEWLAQGKPDADMQRLTAEVSAYRARLGEVADLVARGDMSAAMAARIEAQILPKIKTAEQRMARKRVPTVAHELVAGTPEEVEAAFDSLPGGLEQRREVVRNLMHIEILRAGRGQRTRPLSETVKVTWLPDEASPKS